MTTTEPSSTGISSSSMVIDPDPRTIIDSGKLADRLSREAVEHERLLEVLLEMNVSGETSKHGLAAAGWNADEAAREVLWAEVGGILALPGLRVRGLMTMAPLSELQQIEAADALRNLMAGSAIRESHRHDDPRVQDAYALRCMPQVHGAARNALGYIRSVLETEANSATDNPLLFPDEEGGIVLSGGNFHGQPVAQVLDLLAIAITDLASISERRTERLVNPDLSDLPAFLTRDPGPSSGLMLAQITAAALVSESKILAHPASVDSIPTGASKEDHVSMGVTAARKALQVVRNAETVIAIEWLCAAQALEFLKPLRPGAGVEQAYRILRERVAPLERDRVLAPDIEAATELVRAGALAAIE